MCVQRVEEGKGGEGGEGGGEGRVGKGGQFEKWSKEMGAIPISIKGIFYQFYFSFPRKGQQTRKDIIHTQVIKHNH